MSEGGSTSREASGLVRRAAVEIAVPAVIGLATGACVSGASLIVEGRLLGALAGLPGFLPALPSLAALLLTLLVVRFVTRAARPATAEVYIVAFHERRPRIALQQLPGRVLAAAVTVAGGGSQGLESPSALIGASLGQLVGEHLPRIREAEIRSWIVAGASAGIAAVFSSPGVGTLYGLEVPFRRDVDARHLVPAAVAAGVSYLTRAALIGPSYLVVLHGTPTIDGIFVAGCLLVALGCGLGARLFALATELLHGLAARIPAWVRATIGGVVLAILAWSGHALAGQWITFGPGYVASAWLESGVRHAPGLLVATMLIRTAGTLACVFGGGGGGVFTSLAVTGVFIGEIVALLLGRTESNVLPLLGAACFLGNGYRIPLAGMVMVAESTGSLVLSVAGFAAIGLGQVLMGDDSVSDAKHDVRADVLASAPAPVDAGRGPRLVEVETPPGAAAGGRE